MTVQNKPLAFAIIGLLFSSIATAETPLYAVLMKSLSNPFWSATESGMKNSADNAKVDYYLHSVKDDESTEQQLNACLAMLERKPSIMLTAAINTGNMLPCLQRASELKVPVVDLGFYMDPTQPQNTDIALKLLPDNQTAGAHAADYMAATVNSGKALILSDESDQSVQLVDGFKAQLNNTGSKLTLIQATDNLDIPQLIKETASNYPDFKAVFASNDVIAIHAAESLAEADLNDDIIVVSGSGTSNTFKLVKAGVLHASVISHPYHAGELAVEEAVKILNGNLGNTIKRIPTMIISKEIAQQTTDPFQRLIE